MDIEILLKLQSFRNSIPDVVNNVLFYMTDFAVYVLPFLVAGLCYWCFSKKAGILFLFSCGIGQALNAFLKCTFCINRPWIRDSRIMIAKQVERTATGYSFPSGHSTAAGYFYGSCGYLAGKKNRIFYILSGLLILGVMFTRMWFCAHTLQDVAAGALTGIFSVVLSVLIQKMIEKNPERDICVFVSAVLICAGLVVYFSLKSYPSADSARLIKDSYINAGILLGIVSGWFFEKRFVNFSTDVSGKAKIHRVIIGALVSGIVYFCAKTGFVHLLGILHGNFVCHAIALFVVTGIVPFIFNKIKILENS